MMNEGERLNRLWEQSLESVMKHCPFIRQTHTEEAIKDALSPMPFLQEISGECS